MLAALLGVGATGRSPLQLTRPITEITIPTTVQGLLPARIDRLPAPEKELLQLLAVIGKGFRFGLVQRVAQHADEELHGLLGLAAGGLPRSSACVL